MDVRRAIWLKVQTVQLRPLDDESRTFICITIVQIFSSWEEVLVRTWNDSLICYSPSFYVGFSPQLELESSAVRKKPWSIFFLFLSLLLNILLYFSYKCYYIYILFIKLIIYLFIS